MNTNEFGKVLKELRKEKKITQIHISHEAEIDRAFVSELENGKKQPSLLTVFRIAEVLGVKAWEIVKRMDC